MKVLVPGGCGYVGAQLVPWLLADGHKVTVYDTMFFGTGNLPQSNDSLEVLKEDVRNTKAFKKACKGQDAVIWLAGITNNNMCVSYPELSREINVDAFAKCFDIAKDVERFIFASSVAAYGTSPNLMTEDTPLNPTTPYGQHKAICEGIAAGATIVRAGSVCGLSSHMHFDLTVNKMVNDACRHGEIIVHGGEQYRCHIHMRDLCDLYRLLLKMPTQKIMGEVFNAVGVDQCMPVFKTATIVASVTGANVTRRPSTDNRSYKADSTKAIGALDWNPIRTVQMAALEMATRFKAGYWKDSYSELAQNMRHDLV